MLYQINQAVTSLNLDEVLRDITELVTFVLNAEGAAIFILDETLGKLRFMVATDAIQVDQSERLLSLKEGAVGWAVTNLKPTVVNDPLTDLRFHADLDAFAGLGIQNLVCIPLIMQGKVIGVVEIVNKESGFKSEDVEWLTAVSHQIAIALDNARLYNREQEKVRELAVLSDVSQVITSELDVREVITAIVQSVLPIFSALHSELMLMDAKETHLRFYASAGTGEEIRWLQNSISISTGPMGRCASQNQVELLSQLGTEIDYSETFTPMADPTCGMAAAPLSHRGRVLGVIVIFTGPEQALDSERLNLLRTFANQAAVALDNARLYQSMRDEQERIVEAQEEIRHQLARDLHDGPAQMLSSIIMSSGLARRHLQRNMGDHLLAELNRLEGIARQANREVRTLLFELRPIILESRGLIPAIASYHQQLITTMNCEFILDIDSVDLVFTLRAANYIFAIVQEAINNIRKHANASHIWIRMHIQQSSFVFSVEDDGVGMDLVPIQNGYDVRNSYGLLNMRERLDLLGGRLSIISPRSAELSGTIISGSVPVANIESAEPIDFDAIQL